MMGIDELEPGLDRGVMLARELREIADVIGRCPELACLDNPLDAAQLLLMDLDALDAPDDDL
jgi:hypothetical protein